MKQITCLVIGLALAGCTEAEVESAVEGLGSTISAMTVGKVGDLASRILDDPSVADSLLDANGLNVQALDSLLYDIASDPDARAEYITALSR